MLWLRIASAMYGVELGVCEKLISWPFGVVVLNSIRALIWSPFDAGRDV